MPTGIYPRKSKPLLERLAGNISVSFSGCWEWLGSLQPNGYGTLGVGQRSLGQKRTLYAHRVSYEIFIGKIPTGLDLDHLCRNRRCINPMHLEPVTRSINNKRGIGATILGKINASKKFCKNGHQFNAENTRHRKSGGRACRICENSRRRKN